VLLGKQLESIRFIILGPRKELLQTPRLILPKFLRSRFLLTRLGVNQRTNK
jgi:hypothetical protein